MKYQITIEEKSLKDINYFKKRDKFIFKRIEELLREIEKNPFEGIGKPEALKFELSGYWSRRINREHRLVYKVVKKKILVIGCTYHY
ncbi:MAG: Txe/YoeB family addiction module toxin [Proteobacteria bacterium]|nr:Txe/YoeB family addiction module toxin [Pseudomonadota bacterium]